MSGRLKQWIRKIGIWVERLAVILSFLLITACLALNTTLLTRVFGLDLVLSVAQKFALIAGFQLFALVPALWILWRRPQSLFPRAAVRVAAMGLAGCLLFGAYGTLRVFGILDPNREYAAAWRQVVESEDLLLSFDPHIARLNFSVSNLALPDFQGQQVFADQVEWIDLTDQTAATPVSQQQSSVGVSTRAWPVSAERRTAPLKDVRLWERMFKDVDYFDSSEFAIVRGRFLNDHRNEFETDLQFNGNARLKTGIWTTINATSKVRWRRDGDDNSWENWHIFNWTLERFTSIDSDRMLFVDALDEVLPDPNDLARARTSLHEQDVVKSIETGQPPYKHFERESYDRHPGISVVDLNQDGFDDFYVMERLGENLFFRNNRNGTFTEVAAELGLNIKDHTSSAIFADFDNDGDKDVFLGRTLARSMYLENTGSRFVDRSGQVADKPLPYLVSSISAADYDGDGLLDVYFSTYAGHMINRNPDDVAEFIPREDFEELKKLLQTPAVNKYSNLPGPPNVLLKNRGSGRFVDTSRSTGLNVFRNTYQATWADYDNDGDQDVYVANDFGINNLFRNEGRGAFVDVAPETGTTDIGFGMGVSWGDYNNDGNQDLYVSNMFSKAGRRITAQLDFIDPRFAQMARGNSMFRSAGNTFEKVSGLEAPAMLVEKAGWSWGSQYVDVDNDGFLDVYALSGYYTSPRSTGLPDL